MWGECFSYTLAKYCSTLTMFFTEPATVVLFCKTKTFTEIYYDIISRAFKSISFSFFIQKIWKTGITRFHHSFSSQVKCYSLKIKSDWYNKDSTITPAVYWNISWFLIALNRAVTGEFYFIVIEIGNYTGPISLFHFLRLSILSFADLALTRNFVIWN